MGVLHNRRYQSFEWKLAEGDVLRGMPAQSFPLPLLEKNESDAWGIPWALKVECLKLEANGKVFEWELEAQGTAALDDTHAEKMGFRSARLALCRSEGWKTQHRIWFATGKGPMEDLPHQAKLLLKSVIDDLHSDAHRQDTWRRLQNELETKAFVRF